MVTRPYEKLKSIDMELLAKLVAAARPKIIDTRIEDGHRVDIYEPRNSTDESVWNFGKEMRKYKI